MKVKSLYPIIATKDFEKTQKYYELLGFTVKHDAVTKNGSHVFVMANEADLEVEIMQAGVVGPLTINEGLYGFRMNVKDIDQAKEELEKEGYTIVAGPIETNVGKNLFVKDVNGINITLVQHI